MRRSPCWSRRRATRTRFGGNQFESGVVANERLIEPTENVQVVLKADRFGPVEDRIEKYDALVGEEPIQYGGFKLFYTQDPVLLSPEQVLALDPPRSSSTTSSAERR